MCHRRAVVHLSSGILEQGEQDMPPIVYEISGFLGILLRALGFLVAGVALGRFILENFKAVAWQVQIALVLGFFGLLIALTDFASAGSAGAFALGAGAAYFMSMMPPKSADAGQKPH
jgi:membrane protein DedA with SNARE-associated domain